jgi:predicted amidohydrolase
VADARRADIARATENGIHVIRADVAGHAGSFVSHGSSGIVDPRGVVLRAARQLVPDLVVAEISTALREDAGISPSVAAIDVPAAG